jgi:hypothetical protein
MEVAFVGVTFRESMNSPEADSLILFARADYDRRVVEFWTGTLRLVTVPFEWFTDGLNRDVDFNCISILDGGRLVDICGLSRTAMNLIELHAMMAARAATKPADPDGIRYAAPSGVASIRYGTLPENADGHKRVHIGTHMGKPIYAWIHPSESDELRAILKTPEKPAFFGFKPAKAVRDPSYWRAIGIHALSAIYMQISPDGQSLYRIGGEHGPTHYSLESLLGTNGGPAGRGPLYAAAYKYRQEWLAKHATEPSGRKTDD